MAMLLACAGLNAAWAQKAPAHAAADLVLKNGQIHTLAGSDRVHQAMAIRDGRILALGQAAQMAELTGPKTRVIDLQGRTVIPGLIDSHMHAIRAALSFATEVNWIGARSLTEALARLKTAAQNTPNGQWLIVAGGWTEEQFAERRRPTQAELLAVAPQHPVYVQWMYGWAMLTPAAYQALQIRQESDLPAGGKFELDRDQKPTGAVVGGIVPLFDRLPKPSTEQKVTGTRQFFAELNRVGITGVMDPGGFNMDPDEYQPLFQVWRQGQLNVRVRYSYFAQKKGQELEEFKSLTQLLPMGYGDDMLRFHGIGERVTFSMYNNPDPKPADQQDFLRVARWAAQNGYTLTQHWHESGTVDRLLDVFEQVNREFPIAPLRWSIAHLNDATEANLQRMKALGVAWAMQDAMYLEGDRRLAAHGEKQLEHMPPLNTALRVGVRIGAGTDAHRVADYNPFIALRWMLDGKSASGRTLRASHEIPTRLQALQMYTSGSAWLAKEDAWRGTLEVGKWADLAVLSQDYFKVPLNQMADIESVLTLVGGRMVHPAPSR
jgi:predicted amidohydrolase YtcJ